MTTAGVYTQQFSFHVKASDTTEGTQIDLLIDRQDKVLSLCEIKFFNDELTLTKELADKLRKKRSILKQVTKTKKQVFIVLVTTFGLVPNKHSIGLLNNVVGMDQLF